MTAITLTDAATISVDASLGQAFTVTLGGNRTMANPTNLGVGLYVFKILQDATGGRTLTWGSDYLFGQLSSTVNSTADAHHVFLFFSDGTKLYAMSSNTSCSPGSQLFTSSNVFTVPANCTIYVLAVGGGGAGSSNYGSAGGSGYVEQATYAPNVLSGTVTVTIGDGGTGVVNNNGSGGNTTSFGTYVTAAGGGQGTGYTGGCRSNANGGSGGSGGGGATAAGGSGGGSGSSNLVPCVGGTGGSGQGATQYDFSNFTSSTITAGSGGAAGTPDAYGAGGGGGGGVLIDGAGPSGGSPNGAGGAGYGGGGGGAGYNTAGGNGAKGVVYVEWR